MRALPNPAATYRQDTQAHCRISQPPTGKAHKHTTCHMSQGYDLMYTVASMVPVYQIAVDYNI